MAKKPKNIEVGVYNAGLRRDQEDVISAHFMHEINQNTELALYSPEEFSSAALPINSKLLSEKLIPLLLDASNKFIAERVAAVKTRAGDNFREYGLDSPSNIGLAETITEVMFDRQFLKGAKSNVSRMIICAQIKELIAQNKPIRMVIPALPYKSSSPLKSRGVLPGFAEVNFLLGLVEIAKTIDLIYREKKPEHKTPMAVFTVICDGSRFNTFLNEPPELLHTYQHYLSIWIKRLGIPDFIELADYKDIISNRLKRTLLDEKNTIRNKVREIYKNIMGPLLNPYDMYETLHKAIELDPDPEEYHEEGRFVPLFKSLIYIVKYKTLSTYVDVHARDFSSLYKDLTRNIFEPYTKLTGEDFHEISKFIFNPAITPQPKPEEILEYLRQSMLNEAWTATIEYISEIRSDRDLAQEPITTCLPEHIRWTIHAKPGQLAILTTTVSGDPVQPWHGVAVFKPSKKNKIKLYTLPILSLEGIGATPVILKSERSDDLNEYEIIKQPLFYIHPDIKFENIDNFFDQLKNTMTRSRKS